MPTFKTRHPHFHRRLNRPHRLHLYLNRLNPTLLRSKLKQTDACGLHHQSHLHSPFNSSSFPSCNHNITSSMHSYTQSYSQDNPTNNGTSRTLPHSTLPRASYHPTLIQSAHRAMSHTALPRRIPRFICTTLTNLVCIIYFKIEVSTHNFVIRGETDDKLSSFLVPSHP